MTNENNEQNRVVINENAIQNIDSRNYTWKERLDSHKNIHETFNDLKNELIDNMYKLKRYQDLISNKPNSEYKLGYNDVSEIIIYTCDIIQIKLKQNLSNTGITYGIYNPETKTYIRTDNFLKRLVNIIIKEENKCKLPLTSTTREVDAFIESSDEIRIANLPPSYIIKFNNCIFDIKEKQIHDGLDDQGNEYDFININNYDLKNKENVNHDKLKIVEKVFSLWGKDDQEHINLLRQIGFAALEGFGRNRYIILKSEGGDGKSTFQHILTLLAGETNTHNINLDQFGDDNTLNVISESTKLIIGDDLESQHKVPGKALARLKSLITGAIINLNVKFMPNKLVQTKALMMQNTNTDVNFYENTTALKSRILIIHWPNYNFRDNPITEFDLDALLGLKTGSTLDNDFMEAIFHYIIFNTEYFNKFSITKQMQENTNELLASNDTINMFLNDLDEKGVLQYPYIPNKPIYEYYKDWLRINNPGAKPMKNREFSQKLNKQLKEIGYETVNQKRINKIKNYEFNSKLLMTINDLNPNNYIKSNFYNMIQSNDTSNLLFNKELYFNDNDVSEVTNILMNTEEFNKLNNYNLPLIQYCIEILSKNKLSLLANLESLDNMYLLSKNELIEKLNM